MSIVPAVPGHVTQEAKAVQELRPPGSTMMGPPSSMVDVLVTPILIEGTSRPKPRESREYGNGPSLPSI